MDEQFFDSIAEAIAEFLRDRADEAQAATNGTEA